MGRPSISVTSETRTGPCVLTTASGRKFTTEREVVSVDDWRDTAFGLVNFGFVRFGKPRIVEVV
jgi:hypothetical protein